MNQETQSIDHVRELVRGRLLQLARGCTDFRETYQMSNGEFCGIRFELGAFTAVWKLNETVVHVFHDQQQILELSVTPAGAPSTTPNRRAA